MANGQELFDCPICLQLMNDPVTTACGHSYCLKCINAAWDVRNTRRNGYSCPQCMQTFSRRPVLKRNTLLVALLEEQTKARAADADADSHAADGDVPCDACTGRKRKARMFCLICLASYCETHLKPHFEVSALQKHYLIQADARAKDRFCGRHGKLLEIYCRSDQLFLCQLCVTEEHEGHATVSVPAEQVEMQRQLERCKQEVADRVLNSQREMTKLRQAADSIRDAAWEACDSVERQCAEHIRLYAHSVKRKYSEMREKVAGAEKAGVDWTNSRLSQLEREVLELRRREDELDQLSLTEDPLQFLQGFHTLGGLPVLTDSHKRLDMLTKMTSAQTDKLKNICSKEIKELFSHCEENLLSKTPQLLEEILSRTYLLNRYGNSNMEVDPNTVAACLCLSDRNREISWSDRDQAHPDHNDRFTFYHQALCKVGLKGRHYWEVEWDGGIVDLAVSYKGIQRKGSSRECGFGHNELSWKLTCSSSGCTFWHNNLHKGQIPPVLSRRVGIHLDHKKGTLGFYSVSGSRTLTQLHQIQTTFTKPLFPGFSVDLGSTLKICNI